MKNDHTGTILWFIVTLHLFAFVFSNPPIDTPSRCSNARQPEHGNVKCCIDSGGIPGDRSAQSGGKSSKSGGGSSRGSDVYTCSYSCDKGYKLNGPSVIECPIDKVTDNPTCTKNECNLLPIIHHGELDCTNGFFYESECQYSCAPGFNTSAGSNTLFCQANGMWLGTLPVCQAVRCPPLAEPNHGVLICPNGRSYGADCRYSCDDRYVLNGSYIATCSESGQWIGKAPKCQLGECLPLPLPVHGSLTCTDGWDRSSRCNYTCHDGFSLTGGNSLLVCGFNGFWRGDIPTCELDWSVITPANTTDTLCYCGIPPPENIPDFPIPFEKGNSTTDVAYEMNDGTNGPSSIHGMPESYGNTDVGSGIGTPAIVSIIAVVIICIAVAVGLVVARIK